MAACDWLAEGELSAYLDGELPAARTEEVRGHLATCAGCREDLARLQVVRDTLQDLPRVVPPPHLAATIQRRLGEVRKRQRVVAERRRVLLPLAGAAAAILLVVFSLSSWAPALISRVAGSGQTGAVALHDETGTGFGANPVRQPVPGAGLETEPQSGGQAGANLGVEPREITVTPGSPGDKGMVFSGNTGKDSDSSDNGDGRSQAGGTASAHATGTSGDSGVAPGIVPSSGSDGAATASGGVTAAGVQGEDQQVQPAAAEVTPVAHRASITLQVNDPDDARDRIASIAQAAGGRVEVSYTAAGPVSVLVPPDKFAGTVEEIKAIGLPVVVTVEEPDLSAQYQQTLSKLQSLEKEAAGYRQQLQGGQGTAYVRQLLSLVEQQKRAREQELKNLEEQFSWGVINVTLQGPEPAAPGR